VSEEQTAHLPDENQVKFDALSAEYTKLLNVLAAVVTGQVKREWVSLNMLERSWSLTIPGQGDVAQPDAVITED
jgi:hypothetical protein